MYSPKVVKSRLERLRPVIEQQLRSLKVLKTSERFEFTYHSSDYIKEVISHLDLLVDPNTGTTLIRPLSSEEIHFIRNERAICQCDFRYYATRYAYIQHWEGGHLALFKPNKAQEIALSQWAELEELARAIFIQVLKARQLGMSTLIEIAIAHRVQCFPYRIAVVGSSNPKQSEKMARMMERVWDHMPWWLMPEKTRHKVGELVAFGRQSSSVSIHHGSQQTGIARGDTVTEFHLSELAEYLDPINLVDDSLFRAAHENPWSFGVLEGTGKGRNDWWHKTWMASKRGYWKGRAKLCPMFLPWYIGTDLYPTETWLRARPIPHDWIPLSTTTNHAKKAKVFVHRSPHLRKHLGDNWSLPREQMWYWEVDRKEHEEKNNLAGFYSEMPADDYEAFQARARSVFSIEMMAEKRDGAGRKPPVGVFGIIGSPSEISMDKHPERREIDHNLPPINIRAKWLSTGSKHDYQLVPIRLDFAYKDPLGKLWIWELPEEGEDYGIGVDPSDGVGADRSAIEVIRKGTYYRNDGQVAEYASSRMGALDLWPLLLAIGTLYSPPRKNQRADDLTRQAKMVIECNQGTGESCQLEIRKRGWNHLHIWLRYDDRKINQSRARKVGWYTTSWSRPMMLDYFIKASKDGWLDINSMELLEEMADFEQNDKTMKLQHSQGKWDDRIFAIGMVFFSLHVMETRGQLPNLALQRQEQADLIAMAPKYSVGLQGLSNFQPHNVPAGYGSDDLSQTAPVGYPVAYDYYPPSLGPQSLQLGAGMEDFEDSLISGLAEDRAQSNW